MTIGRKEIKVTCWIAVVLLLGIVCVSTAGCIGTTEIDNGQFGVYYLNGKQTGLVKKNYTLHSDLTSEKIYELLEVLSTEVEDETVVNAIPQDVAVLDYELADRLLFLYFERAYSQLPATREVLLRGAVAKTFLQMDEVDSVSFFVGNEPLKDSSGNVVGAMTSNSFLDTFGEKEEALESDTYTLYYSSEDGRSLIRKARLLHYNNTMSREAVVLSYLARNPGSEDGAKAILSPNTKVLSVTTKEGICHVKFDSSFLNLQSGVATKTAVYGVVNSLTELDDINKVEILIDNLTEGVVPQAQMVNGVYEADDSLTENE